MDSTTFSILLVIVGLVLGVGLTFLINAFRVNNAQSKIKTLSEKAMKEAEKVKRDMLLEAKEESYKLKLELDKEIKENKNTKLIVESVKNILLADQ